MKSWTCIENCGACCQYLFLLSPKKTPDENGIKLLTDLGIVLDRTRKRSDLSWDDKYQLLKKYFAKHGDCTFVIHSLQYANCNFNE